MGKKEHIVLISKYDSSNLNTKNGQQLNGIVGLHY